MVKRATVVGTNNRIVKMKKAEQPKDVYDEPYSECYPGAFETSLAYDSDEEDLTKMDTGSQKKNRLRRWDFETEDAWNRYNDQKEATPRAAFQFGVKMSDGRKTRRTTKEGKFKQELKKINKIILDKYGKNIPAEGEDDDQDLQGGDGDDDSETSRKKPRMTLR